MVVCSLIALRMHHFGKMKQIDDNKITKEQPVPTSVGAMSKVLFAGIYFARIPASG